MPQTLSEGETKGTKAAKVQAVNNKRRELNRVKEQLGVTSGKRMKKIIKRMRRREKEYNELVGAK
jgi:hypothetical protein